MSKAFVYFILFMGLAALCMAFYIYTMHKKEKFEDAGDHFDEEDDAKSKASNDDDNMYRNRVLVMKLFDTLLLRKATHTEIEKYSGAGTESDIVKHIMTDYHVDGKKINLDGSESKKPRGEEEAMQEPPSSESADAKDGTSKDEEYAESNAESNVEEVTEPKENDDDRGGAKPSSSGSSNSNTQDKKKVSPKPAKDNSHPSNVLPSKEKRTQISSERDHKEPDPEPEPEPKQQGKQAAKSVESFMDYMPYQSVDHGLKGDNLTDRGPSTQGPPKMGMGATYYTRAAPVAFTPQDLLPGAPRFQDPGAAAVPTWGADGHGYQGLFDDATRASQARCNSSMTNRVSRADIESRLHQISSEVARLNDLLVAM
jgi:cbb3-type cytochrome oxidase subunit 3